MTRQEVRDILAHILSRPCPADDKVVTLASLEQLEFIFAIEDAVEFRHDIPEDISWNCVNDVVKWLEDKGELQGT